MPFNDHDRLGDLFLLLGMASLGVGCGGVVPLEEDDTGSTDPSGGTTTAPTDPSASMTADPTPGTTSGPSPTAEPATGPLTEGSSTTGLNFTDTLQTSSSSGDSTTTGFFDTTTTSQTTDGTDTTSTSSGSGSTTTGLFPDFTSSGTGWPVLYPECAAWAEQMAYCYFPMYPAFEGFFRYACNTSIMPDYYDYSAACGYAALLHYDCLSTLDCLEWPSVGMGTECDGTFSGMEAQCGL